MSLRCVQWVAVISCVEHANKSMNVCAEPGVRDENDEASLRWMWRRRQNFGMTLRILNEESNRKKNGPYLVTLAVEMEASVCVCVQ